MANSRKAKTVFSVSELGSCLTRNCRVAENANLVVAYSGGLDSHVLIHSLAELKEEFSWQLSVVHINHGLCEEANDWATHCQRVCKELGLPIAIETINLEHTPGKAGIEGEARKLRYQALAQYIPEGGYLLTAHHSDDQAETVLLHLFRGTGVHGLAAMPVRQRFAMGYHIRPLLSFTRSSLKEFADKEKLSWVKDSSNQDTRFSRNYIRHTLLPEIRSRWPQVDQALNRTSGHARDTINLLDEVAGIDLRNCRTLDDGTLDINALHNLSLVRLHNVLRYWMREQDFALPSTKKLNEIVDCIYSQTRTRYSAICWGDAEVLRYRDKLVILSRKEKLSPDLELRWDFEKPIIIPGINRLLRVVPATGTGLSKARTREGGAVIRFRRGGEVCQLAGRNHHSQVKKLLQAAGIPPWERARMPLIYIDEEIAAIGARWVCEPFAARRDEPGYRLELLRSHEGG